MGQVKLLKVREADSSPLLPDAREIVFPNGSLTDNGGGTVTFAGGGDMLSPLTAAEISVTGATTATLGRMHVCSGTAADYTVTLPTAVGNAGKMIGFRMSSALTRFVTIDGNGAETIDGLATRVMWSLESAILMSDGTQWTKIAGKARPMICALYRGTAQAAATGTWVKCQLDTTLVDNTTRMADLTNFRAFIRRESYYVMSASVLFAEMTATTNIGLQVLQNDVFPILNSGSYNHLSGGYPIASSSSLTLRLALTAGTALYLYGNHGAGINRNFHGNSEGWNYLRVWEIPQW